MVTRYAVMLLLFVAAVAVPSRLARTGPEPASWSATTAIPADGWPASPSEPYWGPTRILGEYLGVAADTSVDALLAAARHDARREPRVAGHSLDRFIELIGGDSRERGIEDLRRGLALGSGGQALVAVTALDDAAHELPWMADWANYYAADILAPSGDTLEVRRRLEAAGPDLHARGWRIRVQAARQAGDLTQARRVALEAARSAGQASTRAAAWTLLGELRLAGGDTARAREAFRSAMEGAPESLAAVNAARALSQLGPDPEEWRMVAVIYSRHGNQARAVAGLEAYLASDAGSPDERAQVRLQLGQTLLDAGRFADAERRLRALADEPVPARIAADALYQAGLAQHRQGRTAEAQRTFERVAERFPGQDGTARALYRLAEMQHDDLDLEAARANYRRAASASPSLREAGQALIRLGGLEYLAGRYDGAAAVFDEYRRQHPHGRSLDQATYWAGRSYLVMGREADAWPLLRGLRMRDPLSYYGIQAGELLGEAALAMPMGVSPPYRDRIQAEARTALRRVDVLDALGRRSDVAFEVERLRERFRRQDGGEYALAEALSDRGFMLTAISMGWDIRVREGAWNPRLLRVVYPFPFQELVLPEASGFGVDPHLVAALIRRESAFNPGVVSSAGAIGLMQIMPRTGMGLAREAGLRGFNPDLLKQPELNVQLGVRYLSSLLRQYDGDLALALAAYNAGPSRANRWRRMPEVREPDLFMERIPFAETRDYVRHVKLHLALYRELYPLMDEPAITTAR
jgi:soluble lytic murein transglycosylase